MRWLRYYFVDLTLIPEACAVIGPRLFHIVGRTP